MACLQEEKLKSAVSSVVSMDVIVHGSIESTNAWCLEQSRLGNKMPFSCFAEEQTQGRGRRGKSWDMVPGANIAMSLVWPFELPTQPLQLLPITIAIAIAKALEKSGLLGVQIKWPNDIYVNGKKIAGILIETRPTAKASDDGRVTLAAVIGVGLNYDMSSLENNSHLVLTDVRSEIKSQNIDKDSSRQLLAENLLQLMAQSCDSFHEKSFENLLLFRERYDYCQGKNIEILLESKQVLTGIAQGVTNDAELLALVDGEQRVFNSADISVKAR